MTDKTCTHERGAQEFILVDGRCAFCLIEENERLRSVLAECADDLAGCLEDYYKNLIPYYPNEARRYKRDMDVVVRARKLLGETDVKQT